MAVSFVRSSLRVVRSADGSLRSEVQIVFGTTDDPTLELGCILDYTPDPTKTLAQTLSEIEAQFKSERGIA